MIELKDIDIHNPFSYKGTAISDAVTAAGINKIPDITSSAAELDTLVGATFTAAEINLVADVSLQTETIAEGGVVSVSKRLTKIVSTGAGAVTLAAPGAAMLGAKKLIHMTGGQHDVTLALDNVVGAGAVTSALFTNTNEYMVLIGGTSYWHYVGGSAALS